MVINNTQRERERQRETETKTETKIETERDRMTETETDRDRQRVPLRYMLNYSMYSDTVGRSTSVEQHPMKSLSSVCPSIRPSVSKYLQDWIITFF